MKQQATHTKATENEKKNTIFKQLKPDTILSDVCELFLKSQARLLIFIIVLFYLYISLCTTQACLGLPQAYKDHWIPEAAVIGSSELLCRYWELNAGSLNEQQGS